MNRNEIVMVPLTEILQTVTGSCDFAGVTMFPGDTEDEQRTNFWIEVISYKSKDSGFGPLCERMLDEGWMPDSAIGWDSNNGYITEGHHRLTAAILLCLDEVPTSRWGRDTRDRVSAHYQPGGYGLGDDLDF